MSIGIAEHSIGELKQTVLESFVQGAKLKSWLTWRNCPPAIKECKMLFDKYITNNGVTNNHPALDATMPGQPSAMRPIPTDLQSLTYHKRLVFHAYTHFGAHLLSQDSTHIRNILMMFYSKGG